MKGVKRITLKGPSMRMSPKVFRNKENGEMLTYQQMIAEWREKYEGINRETGLYQYHWHTRYDYIPSSRGQGEL